MKECLVNVQRAIVAHDEPAEVAEPGEGALYGPPSFVVAQRPTVLRRRFAPILAMRGDQLDAARRQLLPQRVTIVAAISDEAERLLSRTPALMLSSYADGLQRRLDEL